MTVRRLGPADLPACVALAADRGWAPERDKWRLLFRVGRVYGADAPDGDGLASTVVATHYGDAAVISMMLVARRYERRGYGKAVLSHALRGVRTALLSATAQGKPLYEHLGFRVTTPITTYRGVVDPVAPTGRTRAYRPAERDTEERDTPERDTPERDTPDRDTVAALDAKAFGARRTGLLAELPTFCADFRTADGGFGGAWDDDGTRVLGPIVAAHDRGAHDLLHDLAAPGGTLRLDADHRHGWLADWAARRGLAPWFTGDLMALGPDLPGDPGMLVTPVMLALG